MSLLGPFSAQTPGPRNAHGLAYDARAGVLILFGGASDRDVRGDTWMWKDGVWRGQRLAGPEPRTFPVMMYDSARDEVVLFGGNHVLFGDSTRVPQPLGDTWTLTHRGWNRLAGEGPPPRTEAAAAYDPVRRRTVLFGGWRMVGTERVRLGDTWEWDGERWTHSTDAGPTPRSGAAMAYHPGLHTVVLFGGSGPAGDTWSWNGSRWSKLPVPPAPGRFNTAMAWDPGRQRLIRFGGWNGKERTSDTWELEERGWVRVRQAGPSSRNHAVLVSAPDRRSVLLYGGHDGDRVFGDLWERRGGRWVQLEFSDPVARRWNGH